LLPLKFTDYLVASSLFLWRITHWPSRVQCGLLSDSYADDIDWACLYRSCVPRFLMFSAAFKSLHRLAWQTGQLCILWDNDFFTLWPQLEHFWLVPFGFTAITFNPAFKANASLR